MSGNYFNVISDFRSTVIGFLGLSTMLSQSEIVSVFDSIDCEMCLFRI